MIRIARLATMLLAGALLPGASASAAITINGRVSQIINALNEGAHFSPGNLAFSVNLPGGPKTLFTGIQGVRNFKDYQLLNDWLDEQPLEQSVFNGGPYVFTHSVVGSYFNPPPKTSSLFDGSPYKFTHTVLDSYFSSPQPAPAITTQAFLNAPLDVPLPSSQPVPEPASWAMMIGGFALVGAAMRRRSAAIRAA